MNRASDQHPVVLLCSDNTSSEAWTHKGASISFLFLAPLSWALPSEVYLPRRLFGIDILSPYLHYGSRPISPTVEQPWALATS